jgi:hypothetical protein
VVIYRESVVECLNHSHILGIYRWSGELVGQYLSYQSSFHA